jgi:D-alanyl-lipoteichoic acid acyltransferase DltB (MBOAT superfamily)
VLFNSYEFLFFFLPLTVGMFFLLCAAQWARAAAAWLALTSVLFYGYWSPRYVVLLLASVIVNFFAAQLILRRRACSGRLSAHHLLAFAVGANLATLGYFKYANFFVESLQSVAGIDVAVTAVVLPIGISFFTFTQIAFLVDTYQGKVHEARFIPYLLFVTYFPHLIAGPVLHHAEMMPQFARKETYRFQLDNFLSGTMIFAIGLFKKVILADGIQPFVAPAFDADPSHLLTGIEAWGAALAYSLQLYFDFSAYSDMAIGLSRMFNVELPLNFNSPYKSQNIVEFWRRWHMTLSRFLRDYLYFPLGGNRLGLPRRYVNLMLTMLLGGLWHGAGWTFVIWGGLHGIFLVVNHAWQGLRQQVIGLSAPRPRWSQVPAVLLTFLAVVVAWVFFRSKSVEAALRMLDAMAGANGWVLPIEWRQGLMAAMGSAVASIHFDDLTAFAGARQTLWIAALLAVAWFSPNSQQIMMRFGRLQLGRRSGTIGVAWAALGAIAVLIFLLAAINASHGVSEFIYFNF